MTARLLAVTAALWTTAPVFAQEIGSQYSSTAVKKCKVTDRAPKDEGDWIIWQCAGVAGHVVRIALDDGRHNVSMGRTLKEAAGAAVAKHQFPSFNKIGETIEWRMSGGQPFATIQRWLLADVSGPKNVDYGIMVVTRLNPTCHAAYVDVRTNAPANANELARQAADQHARSFKCDAHPMAIGKSGRAIELSRP